MRNEGRCVKLCLGERANHGKETIVKSRVGCETFVSEDGGTGIAKISVDELPGNDLMAVESLAVGEMGIRLAGIGRGIVPSLSSVWEPSR